MMMMMNDDNDWWWLMMMVMMMVNDDGHWWWWWWWMMMNDNDDDYYDWWWWLMMMMMMMLMMTLSHSFSHSSGGQPMEEALDADEGCTGHPRLAATSQEEFSGDAAPPRPTQDQEWLPRSILVGQYTYFNINATQHFQSFSFYPTEYYIKVLNDTGLSPFSVIQWNLVIKRSDITKPSYNKVILLVPALIFLCYFTLI